MLALECKIGTLMAYTGIDLNCLVMIYRHTLEMFSYYLQVHT